MLAKSGQRESKQQQIISGIVFAGKSSAEGRRTSANHFRNCFWQVLGQGRQTAASHFRDRFCWQVLGRGKADSSKSFQGSFLLASSGPREGTQQQVISGIVFADKFWAEERQTAASNVRDPWLRGANRKTLKLHNRILHGVGEIVSFCGQYKVRFVIENPGTPRIWSTGIMQKFIASDDVLTVLFDFCKFRERWRKRTQLLTDIQELSALSRLCTSSSASPICSRTQKRHIQLPGVDPNTGFFRTLLANPYPRAFVCEAASFSANAVRSPSFLD